MTMPVLGFWLEGQHACGAARLKFREMNLKHPSETVNRTERMGC